MDAYKEKEYDLRNAIDNINSIPSIFENYVVEVNDFIDREIKAYVKLSDKEYLLRQKYNATREEISKIVYEIEHNPRTNAEFRDKYIIEKLNNLLKNEDDG